MVGGRRDGKKEWTKQEDRGKKTWREKVRD